MARLAALLMFSLGFLICGCPADTCSHNNDCIKGYACNQDGDCEKINPLSIQPESLPDAVVNQLYQVEMQPSGGLEPHTWTLQSNETWLTIQSNTGLLTGTPSSPATGITLKVILTDDSQGGLTTDRTYTLDVLFCNDSLADQCNNHGTCESSGTCNCQTGYTGDQCQDCAEGYHPLDLDCAEDEICPTSNPCSGHGTCEDSTGIAVCTCETGYAGTDCETCTSGYHPEADLCVRDIQCEENTCAGHGDCDDSTGEATCTCHEGYAGEFCDVCARGYNEYDSECCKIGTCHETRFTLSPPVNSANFGTAVAVEGEYMVISAPQADYTKVYHCYDIGLCDEGTYLVGYDYYPAAVLGHSVAIDGNYVALGSCQAECVFIFKRIGTNSWDTGAKLDPPDFSLYDAFGCAVSISGDYVVIGAPNENDDQGGAYIYYQFGDNLWGEGTRLEPGAPSPFHFGQAVDIDGDYAIVGGYGTMSAYIFRRTGLTTWDDVAEIFPSDVQPSNNWYSVSINGDFAIMGHSYSGPEGAAYVFLRTGDNTWVEHQKLIAYDAQQGDEFGKSVSLGDQYVAIGAPGEDSAIENGGAIYVFQLSDDQQWEPWSKITASTPQSLAHFGYSVSTDDVHVLVGAEAEIVGDEESDHGAAYMFY